MNREYSYRGTWFTYAGVMLQMVVAGMLTRPMDKKSPKPRPKWKAEEKTKAKGEEQEEEDTGVQTERKSNEVMHVDLT